MNPLEFELEVYGKVRKWERIRSVERFVRTFAPLAFGVCTFVLIIIAPSIHHPKTASVATIRAVNPVPDDKVLYLRPLDGLQEHNIAFLAETIELRLNVPVAILPPVAIPPGAHRTTPQGTSVFVPHVMSALFFQKPEGAWRVLGVTRHPLHEATTPTAARRGDLLYGYASARDGVGVISIHPFLRDLRSPSANTRAFARDRIARITIHELAHTEDVQHCTRPKCLMSAVTDLENLSPESTLCETCTQTLQKALQKPRVPLHESLKTGDGYFDRGLHRTALTYFEDAHNTLQTLPNATDKDRADVLNRLGAAFIALDHIAEGEQFVQHALTLQPSSTQALYNLALVRAYAGDTQEALHTLKRAMDLDPDTQARHAFAALFYLEALDDPPNALKHVHAYKRAGGNNPSVLARFERLEHPDVIIFSPHEIETIRPKKNYKKNR